MSSKNQQNIRNPIYLKKSSYNTFESGFLIIKKYKITEGNKKGKIAVIRVIKDDDGNTKYKVSYKVSYTDGK